MLMHNQFVTNITIFNHPYGTINHVKQFIEFSLISMSKIIFQLEIVQINYYILGNSSCQFFFSNFRFSRKNKLKVVSINVEIDVETIKELKYFIFNI